MTIKDDKVTTIEINVSFANGDRVKSFIQRFQNINKIVKENPVIQRIKNGELA